MSLPGPAHLKDCTLILAHSATTAVITGFETGHPTPSYKKRMGENEEYGEKE